jgi:aspartyl-tRNA(Asn)/glutamyl-tRNA(Gln) amidotransferase subunit C
VLCAASRLTQMARVIINASHTFLANLMIDREQVRHVAHLGRLQLTENEEVAFTKQLDSILDYFQQLNELDPLLEGVEPTTRAVNTVNVTRPDVLQPFSDREILLGCAPDREEDFFRVPQIMA